MDNFSDWNSDKEYTKQKCNKLIQKIKDARNKLAPIVDDIILSAVDLIQKGDNKFLNECILTLEQYQDVLWATQILKEIEYQSNMNDRVYKWPNTDIIVNNVSVDHRRLNSGKSVAIDEGAIVQLLELYEQMGEVIQIFVAEANRQEVVTTPKRENSRKSLKSSTSIKSPMPSTVPERSKQSIQSRHPISSSSDIKSSTSSDKDNLNPAQIKSTLSVIIKSSSGELNKKHSVTINEDNKCEEDTTIYIKIQCISDLSDENEEKFRTTVLPTNCDNQTTPHYHVQLGGEPVTLKVNQANVEEGAIYCINTGSSEEDNDVRIVIKQCPECFSTVIGSTTKIKDMLGESHESITLHGKGATDESNLEYSSDENISSKDESDHLPRMQSDRGTITDIRMNDSRTGSLTTIRTQLEGDSKVEIISKSPAGSRVEIASRSPSGSKLDVDPTEITSTKTPSGSRVVISQPQMDVIIDTENVDKSNITFNGQDVTRPDSFNAAKSSLDAIRSKKESSVIRAPSKKISLGPLTRRKICSSMEFDVSTVHTRLRDHEIEHSDPHIVVELRKMGVDQILRACRPAKCCRKAILDERQRTGLPYCVSLKSLPLMGNDVEIIKQSYDMSVKKIKNSLDLTENHKEKLAYYISLGRDDFKPNLNFPWVVPVYDLKVGDRRNDKMFVLKKKDGCRMEKSANKRFFILKKPEETSNLGYLENIKKWNQPSGIHNKNLWSNPKSVRFDLGNIFYDYPKVYDFIGKCGVLLKGPSTRNLLESGDCSFLSPPKLLDVYLNKLDKLNNEISPRSSHPLKIKENLESVSTYWKHISEKLFYTSSAVTVFVKRTQSLAKIQKTKRKKVEKEKRPVKKKLEYYVDLVDGDLVWGNSLPLVPQTYKTYYNHDNVTSKKSTPSETHPEPSPVPTNVIKKESQETISTISELPLELMTVRPQQTEIKHKFEPETSTKPWVPFLVSETSLPVLKEVPQELEKVPLLESTTPRKAVIEEPKLEEKKEKCKKKHCGKGIVIDIKKTKNQECVCAETKTNPTCNKEVCELYKNKSLMPDKDPKSKSFTIMAKENIKIVIDSNNVSVTKKECNRPCKKRKIEEKIEEKK